MLQEGDRVACEWWTLARTNGRKPGEWGFTLRTGTVTEPRVWIQGKEHVMVLFPEICSEPIPFKRKHVHKEG